MPAISKLLTAAALATSAFGSVLPVQRDANELEVTLEKVSGTQVKAIVKNAGNRNLSLLNYNFFSNKAPVKKANVFRDGAEVPFGGIKFRPQTTNLSPGAFTRLAPQETFEEIFDVASTADLSEGGAFKALAQGLVQYAEGDSTKLAGALRYKSNELDLDVDGAEASKLFAMSASSKMKRTQLSGCDSQSSAISDILSQGQQLAQKAAQEASSNSARVKEYFMSSDSSVADEVAARFKAVANECSSTTSGATTYHCSDDLGYCEQGVLAYTLPAEDIVVNCDLYWSALEALTQECHGQDQVTTTLHEFTHAPGVYSPGTEDIGYGYEAAMQLTTEEALNNADSYALFANAIVAGC